MSYEEWLKQIKTGDDVVVYYSDGQYKYSISTVANVTDMYIRVGGEKYRISDGKAQYRLNRCLLEPTPSRLRQVENQKLVNQLKNYNFNSFESYELEAIKAFIDNVIAQRDIK